ncbi:MAG: hypothetical protein MUD04_03140 [Cyanobium sp. Prado107]|nr:hypothetical protein [Cyanobium sp. Prado107]
MIRPPGWCWRLPLAHAPVTDLGAWADGAARLLLEPTDLLLAIALVLLALQHGPRTLERLWWRVPAGWLGGALVGVALPRELLVAPLLSAALTALALLVSFRIPLPLWALLALLPLGAGGFALVSGSAMAGHDGGLAVVLAEAVALGLVTGLLAGGLARMRVGWGPIAIQVAGSWIAATSLLLLGWQLRHPS